MTPPNLNLLALQARLAMARFGWVNSISCIMLALALTGGLWGLSYLNAETKAPIRALHQAQQSLQTEENNPVDTARSLPEERLAAYYDVLGDKRYIEQQVKAMFAIANKTGLQLSQGEYKANYDKASRTTT